MTENYNFPDWQQVFDSIFDLVVFVKPDGTIFYCNQRFAQFINKNYDSIIGQKCHTIVHCTEAFLENCLLIRSLKSGKRETWELKEKENYFSIIVDPVKDAEGKIVGFIHVMRDITEQKRAEEALKESEEKYRTVVENAGEIILISQDEMIKYTNPRALEILGYSMEELLSKPFVEFIHPDDRDMALEYYRKVVNREIKMKSGYCLRIFDKQGNLKWLEINAVPIEWQGKPAELNIIRDITELKKAEEEKKDLYNQLLHAQKMEAIGKLSAGIAHEFNNILTSIKGFTQLAMLSISENDPIKHYLQNVIDSSDKAEKLVRQLLAFSAKQILERKIININELIRNTSELIKRLIGEDIILSLNLSAHIGLVEVDPVQIENAIVNLVLNAKDAMPQGGHLIIETENVEIDEEFIKEHQEAKIGQYIMISIKDTGVGIPDEIKDRIFEPFFTTKDEKTAGLGLSTVFGIVKQHGGYIRFESKVGRGTTFKIYLPRVKKELEEAHIKQWEGNIVKGHETVLVIDDDAHVRATVLEMLKKLGYKTLEASNPDIALFLAQFYNKPIQLVICDVVMPGMSGIKLLSKFKNYRPDTKILYMSGYTDDVIAKHGIVEKGINLIQKPFSIEALSRKIREVLDKDA